MSVVRQQAGILIESLNLEQNYVDIEQNNMF